MQCDKAYCACVTFMFSFHELQSTSQQAYPAWLFSELLKVLRYKRHKISAFDLQQVLSDALAQVDHRLDLNFSTSTGGSQT